MIILNNKQFAENNDEFINSLFTSGGTCVGYAKRLKRQVKLFDHQNNLVGVINKHGVICLATPQDKGVWYSYGDIDLLGDYKYADQRADVSSLAVSRDWQGIEPVYSFK